MNKVTKYLIITFLIITSSNSFAQKINISGYVSDSLNNEKLIGATIWAKAKNTGVVTNSFGYFNLNFNSKKEKNILLQISFVGYKTVFINVTKDTLLNVKLNADNAIQQVDVIANMQQTIEKRNEISTVSISMKDLNLLPAIGGERDILKAYQLMPGVQSGTEGKSGLYVRGGSPDQNLILLDDVPLYNVNHLGGFVGIFNNDAINSSKLIKGGFPAQYGSRLSSVLDIRTKDGNSKKRNNSYTLGLLSSKIMFEGPLGKGKTSYLISGRRFMYDLLLRPLIRITSGETWYGYTFYDFNIKVNRTINRNNHLYLSIYSGDDAVSINSHEKQDKVNIKYKNKWGNSLVAFRWNHLYSNRLFSNTTLSYTKYRYIMDLKTDTKSDAEDINSQTNHFSGISDFTLKQDYEFYWTENFKLKFGLNGIWHNNVPFKVHSYSEINNEVVYDTLFSDPKFNTFESGIYIENYFKLPFGFSGNFGLRFSDYYTTAQNFYSLEPRLLLHSLIAGNYKLSLSYAKMQQYVHLVTGSGVGLNANFWMPATLRVPPSQSHQFTIGLATSFYQKKLEFSIEGFYKNMQNLIAFKEGISYYSINRNWEDKVETNGIGKVYGAEFLLQKKYGKSTGWIAYTWSKNTRQFENINKGEIYPYRYDKRHDISIVYNLKINDKIDFSATWVYGTGEAITIPNTKYTAPDITLNQMDFPNNGATDIYSYSSKNAVRGLAYHRLDIGVNFRKMKKKGIRTVNISIYNLYNRANPYFYSTGESSSTTSGVFTGSANITAKSLFPIMPSVSYSYKF